MTDTTNAAAAGTITIGDLTVNRLGFGSMRLTGKASGVHQTTTMNPSVSCVAQSN